MATGAQVWSVVPINNATIDTNVNFAEGMAPSQVNDSSRAAMASVAKYIADNSGVLVTSGSSTALTVATNQVESALTTGFTVTATLGTAMAAAATLAVDGLTATSIFTALTTASLITTGQFAAQQVCSFMFSTAVGPGTGWVVTGAVPQGASFSPPVGTSVTASLASSVGLSTGSYTDGPSVTAGSSGTWFVSGTITFSAQNQTGVLVKLWDGTTVIAATVMSNSTSGVLLPVALSGVLTSPAGNLRMSGQLSVGTGVGGISATSTTSNASTITAIRLS